MKRTKKSKRSIEYESRIEELEKQIRLLNEENTELVDENNELQGTLDELENKLTENIFDRINEEFGVNIHSIVDVSEFKDIIQKFKK